MFTTGSTVTTNPRGNLPGTPGPSQGHPQPIRPPWPELRSKVTGLLLSALVPAVLMGAVGAGLTSTGCSDNSQIDGVESSLFMGDGGTDDLDQTVTPTLRLTWVDHHLDHQGNLRGKPNRDLTAGVTLAWYSDQVRVPGGKVSFTLLPMDDSEYWTEENSTGGAKLVQPDGLTNGDGVSQVTIAGGPKPAQFRLRARAAGAADLYLRVIISNADYPGDFDPDEDIFRVEDPTLTTLEVRVSDSGSLNQGALKGNVYLYELSGHYATNCDHMEIQESNPKFTSLNGAPFHTATSPGLPEDFIFTGLTPGRSYTLLALGTVAGPHANGVTKAWACSTFYNRFAGHKTINLTMDDVQPLYKGEYQLTSNLDLLSLMPPERLVPLQEAAGFFRRPGSWMFAIVRELLDDYLGFSIPAGWLTMVDFLVDAAVNTVLPDDFRQMLDSGGSILDNLSDLQINSTLQITSQPEKSTRNNDEGKGAITHTFPPQSVVHRWDSLLFHTGKNPHLCEGSEAGPDSLCQTKEVSFSTLGMGSLIAKPSVSVTDLWTVTLDGHVYYLDWSLLLEGLMEKVVIPAMVGPQIDSFEKLMYLLFGGQECLLAGGDPVQCCQAFSSKMSSNPDGWLGETAFNICSVGAAVAADKLRETITGQQRGVFEISPILLATSDAEVFSWGLRGEGWPECSLHDTSMDGEIDQIGWAGIPCSWHAGRANANGRLDNNGPITQGSFTGERRH